MLIVVGNGFDLSLGLKTSWKDFLSSSQFVSFANRNLLFQHLKAKFSIQNWIDVENELGEYAKEIHKLPNNLNDVQQYKNDFRILTDSLSSYFSENQIGDRFNSWGDTKAGELIRKVQEIANKKIKPVTVIDFNYTNTFKKLAEIHEGEESNFRVINIHGLYSKQDIIFGYEHSQNDLPTRNFGFIKKSYRSNYSGTILKNQLELQSEVVFFGHSLGSSDHFYFKDFFSSLRNSQSNKDVKVFYYKDIDPIHAEIDEMVNNSMHEIKSGLNSKLSFINSDENRNERYSLLTESENENYRQENKI